MSSPVPYATLYAAFIGLLILALGLNTSLRRMKAGVYKGDGGNDGVHRASRAHGLAVEHGVLLIVLLLLLELQGTSPRTVMATGVAIILVRTWAAFSTLRLLGGGAIPPALTYALEAILPVWLLINLLKR